MNNMKNTLLSAVMLLSAGAFAADYNVKANVVPEQIPGVPRVDNRKTTEAYGPSRVETKLNVEVKEGTSEVHFIRDNSDPRVITKAYPLKNANPYALRGYLLNMVAARKIDSSLAQVEALKFNDGTGLVLVSAEDYRFKDSPNGEGLDTIIARLDRKDLAFSSGSTAFIYFPRTSVAANLMDMLEKVGASVSEDVEFANGADFLMVDTELNAVLITGPVWSWKHCIDMLQQYDRPIPEVRICYRVMEIDTENDDKIGMDFQSWKNNDGVDLFSVGGRYRRNWTSFFTGGPTKNGSNKTEYVNFNPKWNTRYLDFLTSRGKAKTVSSGVLLAKNRETSSLYVRSGFFTEWDGVPDYTKPDPDSTERQPLTKMLPQNKLLQLIGESVISGYYGRGLGGANKGDAKYTSTSTNPIAQTYNKLLNDAFINSDGGASSESTAGVIHGKAEYSIPQDGFYFKLDVLPVVTSKSATMDISLETVSLIGWNSNGTPRRSKSGLKTKVQVGYEGKEFFIGGLTKSEAVRGVSGLPFIKDIPVLGLLVADESESIKVSQLVVVADVEYSMPYDGPSATVSENVGKIVEGVEKGINSPIGNMGFQQLLIDTNTLE